MFLSLLLLTGGGFLFAAEQVKHKFESGFSRFFQVPVHIHRITFLPSEMTLHRIRLQISAQPEGTAPLAIERLQIEAPHLWTLLVPAFGKREGLSRLFFKGTGSITVKELTLSFAGFPLRGQGRLTLAVGSDGVPQAEGWLSFLHPLVEGRVEVTGPAMAPVLMGWLESGRFGRRHFIAQLALGPDSVELSRMEFQGGWNASGRFSVANQRTQALLWLIREDLSPQQITMEWAVERPWLNFEARLMGAEAPQTRDISGSAADAARNGAEAALSGRMKLRPPYPVEMTLDLSDLKLKNLVEWFVPRLGGATVAGRVWGRVALSGPLGELISRGDLSGEDGQFNQQPIRGVSLRFHGKGPILRIDNSHLVRPEGTWVVEGTVDLRRLGQPDFFQTVKVTSPDRDFKMAGWQVSPLAGGQADTSGVQMRRSAKDVGVPVGVNIRLNQEEEFVGVEHREKF